MNGYLLLSLRFLIAVVISVLLTGIVWGINWIIRKVNPEWGKKIDEFWERF